MRLLSFFSISKRMGPIVVMIYRMVRHNYYNSRLRVPLSEPVSYHVKQKLTRVLSAFHATPVSVPITDS